MLKSIRLVNFFSFKDETITFKPGENVLVGINGSGKSNLLKAIELLAVGAKGKDNDDLANLLISKWGGIKNIQFKHAKPHPSENISLTYTFQLSFPSLPSYDNSNVDDEVNISISLHPIGNGFDFFLTEKVRFLKSAWEFSTDSTGHFSSYLGDGSPKEPSQIVLGKTFHFTSLSAAKFSPQFHPAVNSFEALTAQISSINIYHYLNTGPGSLLRGPVPATSTRTFLKPTGENLPQLLNLLKINHKPVYRTIEQKLREVNPHFQGFDFNFLGSGQLELMLDEGELDSAINIAHVSDGTLRFLCLMAILYNPERGSIVCIDEPETGLHPDMLFTIAGAIREAAKTTQIIISTHSDNLLNAFNVEQIRVFEKDEDNATIVNAFTEAEFKGWYEDFYPGRMWRAGDLGGNRW